MPSTYKTPGVYVEEVSLFPPSIAQVETAVPAFIGYTETHAKYGQDLLLKPTKIRSLAEYSESFGGAPPLKIESIILDATNNVTETKLDTGFLMYDSLRLFFANGGSQCYIISVGAYKEGSPDYTKLKKGLDLLEREDEPTLILFPDAVLLSDNKLYTLQQQALMQCSKLGDRFAILDTYPNTKNEDGEVIEKFIDKSEEFRNAIGVNNLKYGAAYGPYLRANLEKTVHYRNIIETDTITRNSGNVSLSGLTSDSDTVEAIGYANNAVNDVNNLKALIGAISDLESNFSNADNDFRTSYNENGANTNVALAEQYEAYIEFLEHITNVVKDKIVPITSNADDTFSVEVTKGDNNTPISFTLDDLRQGITDQADLFSAIDDLQSIISHASVSTSSEDNAAQQTLASDVLDSFESIEGTGGDAIDFTDGDATSYYEEDPTTIVNKRLNMLSGAAQARQIMKTILAELSNTISIAESYEQTYENALLAIFPVYKNIIDRVQNSITDLPPSGAIAGVYTAVDNTRGVFKAPANISLNSVSGLTDTISHDEQQDLNVDVVAGKSINVIRAFTGKGLLVWGARTLAGNDNEWRYISVRRFFNMVEESTKKASEQFVFEANDSNTWVKVKSMIDNFLINQWRAGALAGATHEQAFFVKVGLNQTMTAQDVLEGRMIIEIGMAVVRPAEFIILRFSHKMQES